MKLSALTGLEQLVIAGRECPALLELEFYHTITDLSIFTLMTESCSTLKRVSIFGKDFER